MTQSCPKEGAFGGRVGQAENQSKHGFSLGCSTGFSVRVREKSLPPDAAELVKLPGRLRGKSSCTQFYKAEEIFIL